MVRVVRGHMTVEHPFSFKCLCSGKTLSFDPYDIIIDGYHAFIRCPKCSEPVPIHVESLNENTYKEVCAKTKKYKKELYNLILEGYMEKW